MNESYENQQNEYTNSQSQSEPFNTRKYLIDKGTDTLRDGMRSFNENHPDGIKKLVGGSLSAVGITILLI